MTGHRTLLYQMEMTLPQVMMYQVEENMMLKSVPYSLHLLKYLAFRFARDILEQACFIDSFPLKDITATTKRRIFLEAYSSKGVFLCLFGVFPSYLYGYLCIKFSNPNYKESGV
ncbi:hypothetical protein F2P56_031049 [Juglans regia]|uniref:Uncharacterized protein n=1 Tax=Juglans regia TaxID=51240 RepID=A0A833U0V9_JUGRE|nr:hypothetical protein F2P56_031049 [Juglans regia]